MYDFKAKVTTLFGKVFKVYRYNVTIITKMGFIEKFR